MTKDELGEVKGHGGGNGKDGSNGNSISAEEVDLYDRQIRLWGLEAQNRMRNSKILVINCGALANEIIKNLVLAGVGSVNVVDNHVITEKDLGAQFFVSEEDVGKSRASASIERIQRLNPRVEVSAKTLDIRDVSEELIAGHDVVIATELAFQEMVGKAM